MHRFWIWMIPLLAAICALFLQAAIHGYEPDPFTVGATAPLERPPAVTKPYAPVYPLNDTAASLRPTLHRRYPFDLLDLADKDTAVAPKTREPASY